MKVQNRHLTLAVLAIFLAGLIFISGELYAFKQTAGVPFSSLVSDVIRGWNEPPLKTSKPGAIVFLLLGTNQIQNRNIPALTDTMMAVAVNIKIGRVGLFSIPRDLWSNDYQTKVDALYTYGFSKYPAKPEQFTDEVLGQMADVVFDRTLVITPDAFVSAVDSLGGIDVDVTRPFVDNQYPRSDVDVTRETDPKKLYETVEFTAGRQHMDGARALIYVRSRHATGDEGSDIARARRQREVITVIANKFKNPLFYADFGRLGRLYKLYREDMSSYLSIPDAISIFKQFYKLRNKITVVEGTASIYPDQKFGSIYHPDYSPLGDGQWVFLLKDQKQFQKEIKGTLGLPQ